MRSLAWSLTLFLAAACTDLQPDAISKLPSEESSEDLLTPSFFTVRDGESVKVPLVNVQLSLTTTTDDRCPADVDCFSAGKAKTDISVISLHDPSQSKNLSLCLGCLEVNDSTEFLLDNQKYLLILKEVSPYPYTSQPESMKNKEAEFLVQPME